MGFFKWFTSKAKMKRWMLVTLIGIILVGYGISTLLYFDTLGFTEILKIVCSFVLGFAMVISGFVFMQKRTLELLIEESDTRKETQNINTLIFQLLFLIFFPPYSSDTCLWRTLSLPECPQ